MGKSVIILSPDKHLGVLSSGGLGYTDSGNTAAIGGLALDFYKRLYNHYATKPTGPGKTLPTTQTPARSSRFLDGVAIPALLL
jgi:hypothetical protein